MEEINDQTHEKQFIAYIDDDGTVRDCYGEILEMRDGFITFTTKDNIITIPAHRLLKAKKPQPTPSTLATNETEEPP